jgi:hypothetical protein
MSVRIFIQHADNEQQTYYDASNFALLSDFDTAITSAGANGFITVTEPAASTVGIDSEGTATAPVGAGSASIRINPRFIKTVNQL